MAERSLTVSFVTSSEQASQDATIDVSLDSSRNDGKTQFLYGEKAYYKVYTYPISASITQVQSDGLITIEGSEYETINDIINFANTNESSVSYPVNNIVSTDWFGTSLGAVSSTGKTITSSQSGVGVLKISYRTYFRRYAISVPTKSETTYNVLVYIYI